MFSEAEWLAPMLVAFQPANTEQRLNRASMSIPFLQSKTILVLLPPNSPALQGANAYLTVFWFTFEIHYQDSFQANVATCWSCLLSYRRWKTILTLMSDSLVLQGSFQVASPCLSLEGTICRTVLIMSSMNRRREFALMKSLHSQAPTRTHLIYPKTSLRTFSGNIKSSCMR